MTGTPRPPRILDPTSIPVVGVDQHLPAVAPAALEPGALRRRFASPPAWVPEFAGDGRLLLEREPAPASVLVPLVLRDGTPQVLLTRRTDHLRDHAGQVSFPGGRVEAHDSDAIAAALREAEEEVGLDPALVEVIGQLPAYTTITNFVVTPVVALVAPHFTLPSLKLDPFEVAEAFEVPLAYLMTPAHHRRHEVELAGVRRQFLSMPWHGIGSAGQPREFFIWGATAAMLRNLYRFLSA